MRVFVLIFFTSSAYLTSGTSIVPEEYVEGQRFFHMADGNGDLHLVDLYETSEPGPKFDAIEDTVFYLYTNKNPDEPQVIANGDLNDFKNTNLDVTNPVIMVAHGWNADGKSGVNRDVRNAYFSIADVNVICIDWSGGGITILYPIASARTVEVGRYVGTVIDWLVDYGVPLSNFHLMGHSLGGHLVAIAGRNAASGKVAQLTGFDPALPLWPAGGQRLNINDAEYVEVIHTNGKYLGIMDPLGHNDFYPNGGKGQPGCSILDMGCSHARSFKFFSDSIDHTGFMGTQCESVDDAEQENCYSERKLHLGGISAKPPTGIFHLKTNKNKPYYQG